MKDLLKNKQKKEGVKVRMFTRKEKGFTIKNKKVQKSLIDFLLYICYTK